jgi:hypothetical protein
MDDKTHYPLVVLQFYDHSSGTVEQVEHPLICRIVGWVYKETKLYYTVVTWITGDNMGDHQNNEAFLILKSTVISKRVIKGV